MKKLILSAALLMVAPELATAGSKVVFKGTQGPQKVTQSNTKVINKGTINGGNTTGLTVEGSNNTVVNKGTITGTTGVKMTGGSGSFVNNGTISAKSTGGSSATAVGVSQGN